jgi:hypothetical protein
MFSGFVQGFLGIWGRTCIVETGWVCLRREKREKMGHDICRGPFL